MTNAQIELLRGLLAFQEVRIWPGVRPCIAAQKLLKEFPFQIHLKKHAHEDFSLVVDKTHFIGSYPYERQREEHPFLNR